MVSGGVVAVITTCVIAPFVEEMLFRGLFLRSFLWNYGALRAIIFSSLLFGAAHLNVYQFVIASTLGLLSGWLYVATRSLWPCIFEHAIYNSGVMLYYFRSGEQPKAAAVAIPVHNPLVLLLATASFALGLYWIYLASRRLTVAPRAPHAGGA
jgi:membrane protease YdiL (CAAX protease family)